MGARKVLRIYDQFMGISGVILQMVPPNVLWHHRGIAWDLAGKLLAFTVSKTAGSKDQEVGRPAEKDAINHRTHTDIYIYIRSMYVHKSSFQHHKMVVSLLECGSSSQQSWLKLQPWGPWDDPSMFRGYDQPVLVQHLKYVCFSSGTPYMSIYIYIYT